MRRHTGLILGLLALGILSGPAEAAKGNGKEGLSRGKQEQSLGKERKGSKSERRAKKEREEETRSGGGCANASRCTPDHEEVIEAPVEDDGVRFECKERREIKGGKYRLHLRAIVELPLPNTECKVVNLEDAETAEVRVIFLRTGVPFAVCRLDLIGIRENAEGDFEAKYGLDLYGPGRKRGKKFRTLGYCDVDPHSEAVKKMYPNISPGDEALLYVNGVRMVSGLVVD